MKKKELDNLIDETIDIGENLIASLQADERKEKMKSALIFVASMILVLGLMCTLIFGVAAYYFSGGLP
jgi:hypothetical protein